MTPEACRAWRKRLGLSQRAAAAALGVSPRQVWSFENGQAEPRLTVRLAMAALALGLRDYPADHSSL